MKSYLIKILLLTIIHCSQIILEQVPSEVIPEETASDWVKKLANPISYLIPLQFQNIGFGEADLFLFPK